MALKSIISILFFILGSSISCFAEVYIPPIGIPAPPFGINEIAPTQPNSWPAIAANGYYYIDNTAPNATDTSNTYGYPNKPRISIPKTLAAGAYVEIHGGPYTGSQHIFLVSGTAEAPVWIRGSDQANKPIIRLETYINGSYAIIENLHFDTQRKTLSTRNRGTASAHNICIRQCEFSGSRTSDGNTAVIAVSGIAGDPSSDIVIYNNTIHDFGDSSPSSIENDYHGILPGQYSLRTWVLENHVYNNGGDSIQVGQVGFATDQRPKFVYIGKNVFHGDRENAIDIKAAQDVIVSENTCYDYEATSSSSGEVIVLHEDLLDNVWIINNTVHSGRYGIITTGSTNGYFIGNIIYNIHHDPAKTDWSPTSSYGAGAAIHFRGASNGGAINNTIYDYDTGIQITGGNSYLMHNNILSYRAEAEAYDINFLNSSMVTATEFDYSLFNPVINNTRINRGGTVVDLPTMKANYGAFLNCLEGDPLFVNSVTKDFRLREISPAINSGVASSVYATFLSRYGINIEKDITEYIRPSDGSWDIGAHEFSNTPPIGETSGKLINVKPTTQK